MQKNFWFLIKYYFPVIIWASVIFYFSSIPSLKYTEEIKREILLRKGAHFFEFGILAFLVWRVFYAGYRLSWKRSFLYALILAALYAISDEFHQTLIHGRAGKFIDVVFDVLSVIAVLEIIVFLKIRKLFWWLALTFFVLAALLFMMLSKAETFRAQNLTLDGEPGARTISEEKKEGGSASEKTKEEIPAKIKISVPFTSQAPDKVWDEYHEEACEEASLIMVAYYLNKLALTPDVADKEILDLIGYQNKYYGDYKDTASAETAKIGKDYFDINNFKVIYDFSQNDLKKYLAKGKPIIVPAAGRLLGNPYFTAPGPLYHNLVLTGYDGDTIITNDPGTKRGKDYKYDIETLYGAIHDFTGNKDDIEKGRKAMIVLE